MQPAQTNPPAHDAFRRLLTRRGPDPETLWQEARTQIRPREGVWVLDDSTLDKPYARSLSKNALFRTLLRRLRDRGLTPRCVCFDSWYASASLQLNCFFHEPEA